MSFVVSDLDGTLCDISHRLHHVKNGNHNWDAFFQECDKDVPKPVTIAVVNTIEAAGHRVEIWSGRSDIVRDKTEKWLKDNGVKYDLLRMRKHGDHRPDVVIKKEWLDQCGIGRPELILDDRQCVVDMWRENGITCFQVDQWDEMDNVGAASERIKPLNPDVPLLTIMVGPSAAGKSVMAQAAVVMSEGKARYLSSDLTRAALCGDFKDQSRNEDVFKAVHTLIKTYIDCGIPVIYDATNIKNKDRIAAVKCCPEDYKVQYWVVDRPLNEKIRDGDWRNEILLSKGCSKQTLIEYHDQVFKSNLKDIMNGDGFSNVEVIDCRVSKD